MEDLEDYGDDCYYEETHGEYKKQQNQIDDYGDYGEEGDEYGAQESEHREMVTYEAPKEAEIVIEKVEPEIIEEIEVMVLDRIFQLLEQINSDMMSMVWKPEQQRIYNILMAFVVNNTNKSKDVCRLLGKCFNRLVNSANDQYFIELGIPEEWYNSKYAENVKPSDFQE